MGEARSGASLGLESSAATGSSRSAVAPALSAPSRANCQAKGGSPRSICASTCALPIDESGKLVWHPRTRASRVPAATTATPKCCSPRGFAVKVVLIFRPAEESTESASEMIEAGLMDQFGAEEVYGIQNWGMCLLVFLVSATVPSWCPPTRSSSPSKAEAGLRQGFTSASTPHWSSRSLSWRYSRLSRPRRADGRRFVCEFHVGAYSSIFRKRRYCKAASPRASAGRAQLVQGRFLEIIAGIECWRGQFRRSSGALPCHDQSSRAAAARDSRSEGGGGRGTSHRSLK
ncbi:hypothetical protein ABIE89_000285 [Bradyrhizobium niftali]